MFGNQCFNFFFFDRSEDFDITLGIGVAYIQPELIELVRWSIARVQPDISGFCFTKLTAVSFCNQRASQCEHLSPIGTADQFGTGSNVSPLVGTTHLKLTALCFIQMKEVISLKQLISELGKWQSITRFTIQTAFYRVFCHHIIHSNVLTYFASKIEESEIFHPVIIVHQFGTVRHIRLEVEELGKLIFNTCLIVTQCFLVQQVTFCWFSGRVSNHTCSATDQCQRLMTAALEMTKDHHSTKVTNV